MVTKLNSTPAPSPLGRGQRPCPSTCCTWSPRPQNVRGLSHQTADWFPVTAELSSTTRERLRGILVDARLGVTGRVRRPRAERAPSQREIILPVTIEEGLD